MRNLLAAVAVLVLPGCDGFAQGQLADIQAQAAKDAEDRYSIAVRGGDFTDMCVHAKIVAAAHLQAKHEAEYNRWKAKERFDCDAAKTLGILER